MGIPMSVCLSVCPLELYKYVQSVLLCLVAFEIYGTETTNQNLIHEEIKSRLYLDNVYYHSF
jgi:hypothetical protein